MFHFTSSWTQCKQHHHCCLITFILFRSSSEISYLCSSCSPSPVCPHCLTLASVPRKRNYLLFISKACTTKSLLHSNKPVCLSSCFPTNIKIATLKYCCSHQKYWPHLLKAKSHTFLLVFVNCYSSL